MFCPKCSQEQISTETRFCSRCGFLMTGVIELVERGGEADKKSVLQKLSGDSPRKKGVKQGLFIFLLSFLIVPIIAIITVAADVDPYAVAISAILLSVGGFLRVVYALLLQSNDSTEGVSETVRSPRILMNATKANHSLPSATTEPAASFVPPIDRNWRDTNDLMPASVTEATTNLLDKETIEEKLEN